MLDQLFVGFAVVSTEGAILLRESISIRPNVFLAQEKCQYAVGERLFLYVYQSGSAFDLACMLKSTNGSTCGSIKAILDPFRPPMSSVRILFTH